VRLELEAWVDRQAERAFRQGLTDSLFSGEPFERRLISVAARVPNLGGSIRRELHVPGFFPLFFHPRLLDIVEQILGEEIRLYPNYSARPKLPFDGPVLLWHQDAAYTPAANPEAERLRSGALRMMNVWASLVPARPENGCMQFVPGSHRLGVVSHVETDNYLMIAEHALLPYRDLAIDIPTDPGDIVIFSNMLFHTGQLNRSEIIRWSCDWRYQDARQPTLRVQRGHLARSRACQTEVTRTAKEWVEQGFC
jgi:ectoine hydroxylase-related dioxygenase (phytanoyl-CoA dioxygenase family)